MHRRTVWTAALTLLIALLPSSRVWATSAEDRAADQLFGYSYGEAAPTGGATSGSATGEPTLAAGEDKLELEFRGAADTVVVPVQCEYYALEGVTALLDTIRRVRRGTNPSLTVEGILLTMYDGRTNLSLQVASEVKKHFKSQVFPVLIPRNVRLGEAPSHGKPISVYDPRSQGGAAYEALAKEIIRRNQGAMPS